MSRFAEWIAERVKDGALLPASVVQERFRELGEPEEVTTGQAHRVLGRSVKFWRMACEAGAIDGAYRDSEDSPWRLPLASCRKHLLRLANKRTQGLRGPTKKSSPPAQAASARPSRFQKGPVLVDGHEAVGRPTMRAKESA